MVVGMWIRSCPGGVMNFKEEKRGYYDYRINSDQGLGVLGNKIGIIKAWGNNLVLSALRGGGSSEFSVRYSVKGSIGGPDY